MKSRLFDVLCLIVIGCVGDFAIQSAIGACFVEPADAYFYKGGANGNLWKIQDTEKACYRNYRIDSDNGIIFDGDQYQNTVKKLLNNNGCTGPCSYDNTHNLWLEGCTAATDNDEVTINCYPEITDP